ncbi:hypothetical protein Goklo_003887 [Gossypium klotzschianum]|nr:hypothetical protein [Gossypium klotzschianum]
MIGGYLMLYLSRNLVI